MLCCLAKLKVSFGRTKCDLSVVTDVPEGCTYVYTSPQLYRQGIEIPETWNTNDQEAAGDMFNECQKNFTQRLGDLGPSRTTTQTQKLSSQKWNKPEEPKNVTILESHYRNTSMG